MYETPGLKIGRMVFALALLLSVAGCGGGGDGSKTSAESKTHDSPETSAELWLLQTRVYSADFSDATGYAIPVDRLVGHLTSGDAIEQYGGGWIYGRTDQPDGSFLLTHGERGEASRYRMSKDNRFIKGKTVSFAGYGVHSGYGIVAWVDAHTVYWFDSEQLQVIRFDPTSMEIDDAFPIEGVTRKGFRTWFSDRPVVHEDGVFITMNWSPDWEKDVPDSPAGSALVHIDPGTDEITVTKEGRCTSLLASMTTPDGDTYFFSSYENAYVRIATGGKNGMSDCALRVRKGESKFDPQWSLDLTERAGGRPADGILPGDGYTMWLRVYHSDKVETQPTDFEGIDSAPAWQWYKLDFSGDSPAVENTQRPYSTHGTAGVLAQGRSFFMVPNDSYSESLLLELKDDKFVELASVAGELDTLMRVR